MKNVIAGLSALSWQKARSVGSCALRCAGIAGLATIISSCADKELTRPNVAFNPKISLQVTMTAVVSTAAIGFNLDGGNFVVWTMRLWWAFGITVFGATVAAFLLQSWGQRHTTATRAAVIFAMEPVFAGLASYFWLGERLTGRGWTGAALVLVGVLLAELKPGGDKEHSSK